LVPAATSPQAPSAPAPFSALVQATQGPVHAVSQQTASAQKPLAHWSAAVHAAPFVPVGRQSPVGVSQYRPLPQSASCSHPAHVPRSQKPVAQSAALWQCLPAGHAGHGPPQSTSLSPSSCTPSEQVAAAHVPAMQTSPFVQSLAVLHPTQWPSPSHTEPPPPVQGVPSGRFPVPQVEPGPHVAAAHGFVDAGQSEAVTQATQSPLPSQTAPP
jgi:hypothetical protein